jgi:hypothetical protein
MADTGVTGGAVGDSEHESATKVLRTSTDERNNLERIIWRDRVKVESGSA